MKALILTLSFLFTSLVIFGHGKETHGDKKQPEGTPSISESIENSGNPSKIEMDMMKLGQINQDYQKRVKPIFQKKCLDCHGIMVKSPWYYVIPGITQAMDHDIQKAKEHLDMTNNFPFGGHGDPISDLNSLRKSIVNNTMPIFVYRLTHWDAELTEAEKELVFEWINDSIQKLESK